MQKISLRQGFNDVWMFDTRQGNKTWTELKDVAGHVPKKRMNHAAGIMGCVMIISGGYNTEAKVIMDDF